MNPNDKYANLRKKLDENTRWPEVYMFKFIITADNKTIALIEQNFSESAEIFHQPSSTGKYLSITVKEVMTSTDEVIGIYKKIEEIPGVMAL